MKKFGKMTAAILAMIMILAIAASCNPQGDPENQATEEPAPTATPVPDDPESTTVIAMVGDQPIYSNEFYYFLYQGVREFYYKAEDIYDPNADDTTNLARMREYFYSTDEEGVTYLERVADRTLEIAQGFKIAYKEGKELASREGAKYTVDQDELDYYIAYIDEEADYGASMYGCSRDEYFFYIYGMNVNDAKRYTSQQIYAELHESYWADDNGYVIGMDEPVAPTEPVKPTEPGESATDEEKSKYSEDLAKYEADMAEYETARAAYVEEYDLYEKKVAEFYEKFRDEYNENESLFGIRTVRTLYVSKLDSEGNPLGEAELEAKRNDIDTYIGYVENGQSFEKVVKGFSEGQDAATSLGLTDINVYEGSAGDLPKEVIDRAFEIKELSEKPELVETDTGFYLIMVEGIVTYDETIGLVYDGSVSNHEKVRNNVQYSKLSELYNSYVEELMKKDEYAVTEINREEMMKLAKDYIDFTTVDEG